MEDSPKHGPTLSTSTSSFEPPLDPHDDNLSALATNMFEKTSDFIKGEFQSSLSDYVLLQRMNEVTKGKYLDIQHIMSSLQSSCVEMNSKLEQLKPILQQIDEIDETVQKLEASANKLDAYSLALEKKLQYLTQPNQ